MQQHFVELACVFSFTPHFLALVPAVVLLAQVRIPGFHLKTGIIRGLSPVSYKIQSVSATLAFTANLDLKPTGGKLSAGRPGFSETRVQV